MSVSGELLGLAVASLLSVGSSKDSPRLPTSEGCPPLVRNEIKRTVPEGSRVKLVFFSSWCSECLPHLKAIEKEDSLPVLAIAVFDTQKKVEKTLSKLGLNIVCRMDDGLARQMGVKSVPFERVVDVQKLFL